MFVDENTLYAILRVVVIVLGTLGMMCSTTEFKYSARKIAGILSLYILYVLGSTYALVYFFGYLFFVRIFLLTITTPAILLLYKIAKSNPTRAIFTYATQVLFSLYVCATIMFVNTSIWNSALADLILLLSSFTLVIWLEYRFIRRPFLYLAAHVKNWGILSLLPCSLMLFSVFLAFCEGHYSKNPTAIKQIYLFGVVIIIIYFAVFQNLYTQYRFQLTNRNAELLELQVNNLTEKLTESQKAEKNARIERHDTRHKFQITASLLENGNTKEALEYIQTSLSQIHEPTQILYCNNPILNATLSTYLEHAKKEQIELETHFSFPDILPVDAAELSIVFANALENAIYACIKLPEENRKIICKCIHNPTLMIEVSNPCEEEVLFSEDNLPLASENGHGFGTRSIAAFCKKYDALYIFEAKDGWFIVKIVL